MAVIEMREALGRGQVTFEIGEDVQVVQKRINLKPGPHQRNMLQMDLFIDEPITPVAAGPFPEPFLGNVEFFVTPTPIILTDNNEGPLAANQLVLFKAIIGGKDTTRFPQDFLATNANFPFFHDQLFITMIFTRADTIEQQILNYGASIYMSYSEKRVPPYRAAMGVISEKFASMIAKVQTNGRSLMNVTNLAGSFIPSYNWGGIRPEYMVSANNISQFFLPNSNTDTGEDMINPNQLRTFALYARTMVENPTAFGVQVPVGGIPDWFRTILPKGIEAGPVRSQFPPRVTQDNPADPGLGNILMV